MLTGFLWAYLVGMVAFLILYLVCARQTGKLPEHHEDWATLTALCVFWPVTCLLILFFEGK